VIQRGQYTDPHKVQELRELEDNPSKIEKKSLFWAYLAMNMGRNEDLQGISFCHDSSMRMARDCRTEEYRAVHTRHAADCKVTSLRQRPTVVQQFAFLVATAKRQDYNSHLHADADADADTVHTEEIW
jgi:hypothetical protein